jgi:hypothetical protein
MRRIYNSTLFWQAATVGIITLFVVSRAFPGLISFAKSSDLSNLTVVKSVEASEVYPMFTCPCCDQPLNKEEPCCGAMISMIDFIDEQVDEGFTEAEIILATAKEFGIDRLSNEEDQLSLKQKLSDMAPADAPKLQIVETSRDLGEVSQARGEVSTDFELRNNGKSDLLINRLSSSCGCTSAAIVLGDELGPRFTMEGHGQENPTDWEVAIKPGGVAILRVYYDPNVHGEFVGAVTRTVSVFSNDPVEFEVKVTITLDQVK